MKPFELACLIVGIFCGFLFGIIFGNGATIHSIHTDAIQHGFAEYNATNGAWQWRKLEIIHYHDVDYAYPREMDNYNSNYVEQEIKQQTIPALPRYITRFVTNVIVDDHIIIDESGGIWIKQEMKK